MKKIISPKIYITLALILISLSGCAQKTEPIIDSTKEIKNISQEDTFSKKLECGKLSENIEKAIMQEQVSKKRNVILQKIFYSPKHNSCLYAYVVEDDVASPQCKLDSEMEHNDTFIIKDYLTGENIFYKTKGCNNFRGDNFDEEILNLENK